MKNSINRTKQKIKEVINNISEEIHIISLFKVKRKYDLIKIQFRNGRSTEIKRGKDKERL